jgi:hypothetical protein
MALIFRTATQRPWFSSPSSGAGPLCAKSSPPLAGACIACRATDDGYGRPKLKGALKKIGRFKLEIVKRLDKAKCFVLPPRRLGGRENLRVAGKMPQARQGFRTFHRLSRSMDIQRQHPHDDAASGKGLKSGRFFRIRP